MRRRAALVLLLAAATLVRLPALAQPLGIDQGIFAYAGRALLAGKVLYRDVWDQKPPGIHLTYAAAFASFGDRAASVALIDLVAALATAALVAGLARAWFAHPGAGPLAAVVFLVLTWPAARFGYGGFLERAVPETFIALWSTLAVSCVRAGLTAASPGAALAAGVALGLAVCAKPIAALYLIPLGVMGIGGALRVTDASLASRPSRAARAPGANAARVLAGMCLPPLALVAWLARAGALADARVAIIDYNIAYVRAAGGLADVVPAAARESWRLVKADPLWLLGAAGALVAVARALKGDRGAATLVAWLAASGLAIVANGGRLFSNYYLQAQPPLALAATLALVSTRAWHGRGRVGEALLATGVIATLLNGHAASRAARSLSADVARWRGAIDETTYLDHFGAYGKGGYSARANAELATYLVAHTEADEQIFIFGFAPAVYYETRRTAASRFVWIGPVVAGFVGRPEFSLDALAAELDRRAPAFLVLERNNRDRFLGWEASAQFAREPMRQLVDRTYVRDRTIEDFELYRRSK